jgi:hypothetical protein
LWNILYNLILYFKKCSLRKGEQEKAGLAWGFPFFLGRGHLPALWFCCGNNEACICASAGLAGFFTYPAGLSLLLSE